MKASAFIEIRNELNKYFDTDAPFKKDWMGKRVVAIDGSQLNLPTSHELFNHFGTYKNQTSRSSIGAIASIAYDVCNNIILDANINPLFSSESELSISHLDLLNPETDILVFDRGYPRFWLIALLQKKNFKFCFRLSTSWKQALKKLENISDTDWALTKSGTTFPKSINEEDLPDEIKGLRLTAIILENGEKEILLTNLTDKDIYTIEVLKSIYHLRWGVEESYKKLKQITCVEFFTGRTIHAIEQDFHARILMLNISSMIDTQSISEIVKRRYRKAKHVIKTNFTQVVLKVKDFMIDLFYRNDFQNTYNKIVTQLEKCYDIERKNRHFERKSTHRARRKPLSYKA